MTGLSIRQDVRDAVRRLRHAPLVAGSAILACGLAVGLATTIYSAAAAVLVKPLPFDAPERLIAIWKTAQGIDYIPLPAPEFLDLRERATTLDGIAALTPTGFAVGRPDGMLWTEAFSVTADWFDVLGVRPLLGRTFAARDDAPGAGHVVVLTEELWQHSFGADPGIIGSSVLLSSSATATPEAYEVVGVVGTKFELSYPTRVRADLYVPRTFTAADRADAARRAPSLITVARVRNGTDVGAAAAEVASQLAQLEGEHPTASIPGAGTRVVSLHEEMVGRTRPVFLLLAVGAAILLLISIANVTALLLAAGTRRVQDLRIRLALGATPTELARRLLTEYAVIALLTAGLGMLLAAWATPWLQAAAPGLLPRFDEIRIDGSVGVFALGLAVGVGLCFGSTSTWVLVRQAVTGPRRGRVTSVVIGHGSRARPLVIVGEAALVTVLLAGAALVGGSVWRLTHLDLGFDPTDVLVTQVLFPVRGDSASMAVLERGLIDEVRSVPGVVSVSLASSAPFAWSVLRPVRSDAGEEYRAVVSAVSPEYFDTLDLPLLQGRLFAVEATEEPSAVVINHRLEALVGHSLLGRRIDVEGQRREVVGVVGDVTEVGELRADLIRETGLQRLALPAVYIPRLPGSSDPVLLVETTTASPQGAREIRNRIDAGAAGLVVRRMTTLSEMVATPGAVTRFVAVILAGFSITALLVATVGLSGLLAHTVGQRRREIGLRMALGARPGHVKRLVAGKAVLLAALGVGLGLGLALVGGRTVQRFLFEMSPTDPITIGAVLAVLLSVAGMAAYFPARRAARTDPAVVLRAQ